MTSNPVGCTLHITVLLTYGPVHVCIVIVELCVCVRKHHSKTLSATRGGMAGQMATHFHAVVCPVDRYLSEASQYVELATSCRRGYPSTTVATKRILSCQMSQGPRREIILVKYTLCTTRSKYYSTEYCLRRVSSMQEVSTPPRRVW